MKKIYITTNSKRYREFEFNRVDYSDSLVVTFTENIMEIDQSGNLTLAAIRTTYIPWHSILEIVETDDMLITDEPDRAIIDFK